MNRLARIFGVSALAALTMLPLAACTDATYGTNTDPQPPTASETVKNPSVTYNQVATGVLLGTLPNGTHIVTYPGKDVGTPNDLKCLVVKEELGLTSDSTWGLGGISCDWAGARGAHP